MSANRPPFAPADVSLGLYLHQEDRNMRVLRRQAHRAADAGFAGVTLAEHHADQAGYVANPLLAAATLAGELPTAWVAAAPTILGLRGARSVAEDVMWLNAMFPGRVGLAVGAGYDRADFEAVGRPFHGRLARFRRDLAELGRTRLGHRTFASTSVSDIPVLVATRGPRNIAAAARAGLGLLLPPLPAPTARRLADGYRANGGRGPVAAGRWVWVGDPPEAALAAMNTAIGARPGDLSWRDADSVLTIEAATTPEELADRLVEYAARSTATHLHLRIHLPGLAPERVERQIEVVGRQTLPLLRSGLAGAVR